MRNNFDTELKNDNVERLALLLEECGGASQIIGKILRHGFFSFSPFDASQTSNRALLEKELGDIYCAVELMCRNGDIDRYAIVKHMEEKKKKVGKYLHFNAFNDDPFTR